MLSAHVNNLDIVPFVSPALKKYIEQAREFMATEPESGCHKLDGEAFFINAVSADTVPVSERMGEVHARYVDIHILIEGGERIGYGHLPVKELEQDMLETDDAGLFKQIEQEKFIDLKPGDFALFYPGEPHRPLCNVEASQPVKKLIVKIDCQYL